MQVAVTDAPLDMLLMLIPSALIWQPTVSPELSASTTNSNSVGGSISSTVLSHGPVIFSRAFSAPFSLKIIDAGPSVVAVTVAVFRLPDSGGGSLTVGSAVGSDRTDVSEVGIAERVAEGPSAGPDIGLVHAARARTAIAARRTRTMVGQYGAGATEAPRGTETETVTTNFCSSPHFSGSKLPAQVSTAAVAAASVPGIEYPVRTKKPPGRALLR